MFTKNDTLHCLKVGAELQELFLIDKFKINLQILEKMKWLRNIWLIQRREE